MFRPSDFSWSESLGLVQDKPVRERFSTSAAVREWLVYQALTGSNKPIPPSLRVTGPTAFERVGTLLKKGLIELDYKPDHLHIVYIPPINDPLYMQAMLYWSVRMACSLPMLADAYAQLGKYAPSEQMQAKIKSIREAEKSTEAWLRTDGHTNGMAATLPMPLVR